MRILKHGPIVAPYTTHTFWKTPVKSAPTRKNTNFPDTFMLEQVKSLGSPLLYLKLTKSTPLSRRLPIWGVPLVVCKILPVYIPSIYILEVS